MATKLDQEEFLTEISSESPCGENLEYASEFLEMESAAESQPPSLIEDATVESKQPNWNSIKDQALTLLRKSRDVRIAALIARALGHTEGFSGYAEGMVLVRGLLERHWDDIHPGQDPDDDYPVLRMNVLRTLHDESVSLIQNIPIIEARGLGSFTWRDVQIAEGYIESDSDALPTNPEITAAFKSAVDNDYEAFDQRYTDITRALEQVRVIHELLVEKVGSMNSVDFSQLIDQLERIGDCLNAYRKPTSDIHTDADGNTTSETADSVNKITAAKPSGLKIGGAINSRDEVIRVLDLACDYYARQEPSSPIPFLLRRAKRMVPMDFIQILEDLVPDGVNQAQSVCGFGKDQES